jgi:triacylglycerol lipase
MASAGRPSPEPRSPRLRVAPLARDVCTVLGLNSSTRSGPRLATATPVAVGHPVLLVPGFLSGDESLAPLAARLAEAGHRPLHASIARNIDCSEATVQRLTALLEGAAEAHHSSIALVGHSRGGLLARVIGRRRPDLVSGVVTLGSPIRSPLAIHPALLLQALLLGTAGTLGLPGVVRLGCAAGRCCAHFRADLSAPLPANVGSLVVYSREDAVVHWRTCLDEAGGNVEVFTSHCGMLDDAPTAHLADQAIRRFAAARIATADPLAGGPRRAGGPAHDGVVAA